MVHTDEESTWLIKELSNFSIETLILKNISTLDNYVSNNKEVSSLFIVPGVNASNTISAFNGQLTFFETHYSTDFERLKLHLKSKRNKF